jgi:uncharacterized repeat protein (TIGR01451 family)
MKKLLRGLGVASLICSQIFFAFPALAAAPSNIIWAQHNDGISGGIVVGVVVDPSASSTVYALTQTSGIFKSTDAGANWSAINTGLPAEKSVSGGHLFGNLLTIDQRNPSRLYANFGGKPFKTTDGGSNWSEISTGIADCDGDYGITGVAIDPQNSSHLLSGYIASGCAGGLYESTDTGANWTFVSANGLGNDAWTIAFNPASSSQMYVNTVHVGVSRSTDAGANWTNTSPTLGDVSGSAIVVHPTSTSRVFMGYQDADGGGGLYLSTDNAATWTSKTSEVSGRVQDIRFSSSSPTVGYAASSDGVFKTADGGLTWAAVGSHAAKSPKALAINPLDSSIVYLGTNGGGIYKSTDSGVTFTASNTGLPVSLNIGAIAIAPSASSTYYAAASGIGFFRSTDRGYTWTKRSSSVATVNATNYIAISPTNEDVIYAGFDQVYKSTDGGANWTSTGIDPSGTHWFQSAAVDPQNASHVIVADSNLLKSWRSTDAGATWATSTTLLPSSYFYRIVFDQASSSNVYAATYDYVWRSTNNGATWAQSSSSMSGSPSVDTLALDPSSPGTVYIGATSDKIFKSTDYGATWATTTYASNPGGTSPSAVRIAPSGAAYAFTLYGWKRSLDRGATWTSIATSSFSGSLFLPKFTFQIDPLDSGRFLVNAFGGGIHIYEDYAEDFGSSEMTVADNDGSPINSGDTLTATTTVTNSGTATATNTLLRVDLPANAQYAAGSSRVDGSAISDPDSATSLSYNLGTLQRNDSATVSFKFTLSHGSATIAPIVTSAADTAGTEVGSVHLTVTPSGGGGGGSSSAGSDTSDTTDTTPPTAPVADSDSPAALQAQIASLLEQITALRQQLGLFPVGPAGIPGAPAAALIARDLSVGSTGADVKTLQIYLNTHGFILSAEGPGSPGQETEKFGALTRAALAKFQAKNGISPALGYFGPKTRAFLNAAFSN